MRLTSVVLAVCLLPLYAAAQIPAPPQTAPQKRDAAASEDRDVYHVMTVRAAPGRLSDLLKMGPSQPAEKRNNFSIVFRHVQGQEWDLLVIEHLGEKATVERGEPDPGLAERRGVTASHTDTFVLGPPLAEFRKQLGLDKLQLQPGAPPPDVYVISMFTAVPGHQPELRQALQEPAPGDTATGDVTLMHLEGGPWNLMTISHYASWQEFAKAMSAPARQQTQKPAADPTGLRQHMSTHVDTIAIPWALTQGGAK